MQKAMTLSFISAGLLLNGKNYDGVTHEFFGMGAVVPQAKEAEAFAVEQLKNAFNSADKK